MLSCMILVVASYSECEHDVQANSTGDYYDDERLCVIGRASVYDELWTEGATLDSMRELLLY
jgi:hypothetical protein